MKPERWQQQDQLLEAALERPPAERAAFVGFFATRAPRFVGGEIRYRQALESIDLCLAARAKG